MSLNVATIVSTTPPRPAARAQRVLLVDDDGDLRSMCAILLEQAGVEVMQAEDGERAWECLVARTYHLIIAAHVMGGCSGLDLVRRMRSAGVNVPVIVMSSTLGIGYKRNDRWERVDAVLKKPFSRYHFLSSVEMALHPDSRSPFSLRSREDCQF